MSIGLRRILPYLAIPGAAAGYIAGMGLTRTCPTCTMIVDGVCGVEAPASAGAGFAAFDLEGNPIEIELGRGGPCVVDLWSTSCPPCIEQRRVLAQLAAAEGAGVRIVSVAVDRDIRAVAEFIGTHPGAGQELIAGPETVDAIFGAAGVERGESASLELPVVIVWNAAGRAGPVMKGGQSLEALTQAVRAGR